MDLATMLAEMDSRLQALQRELEEVAVPITRRGVQPRPNGSRSETEPPAESSAPPAPGEAARPTDPTPTPPAAAADTGREAARPRRSRPLATAADAAPGSPTADPVPAVRKRARRVTAVQGKPAAPPPATPLSPTAAPPSPPSRDASHSAPPAVVRTARLAVETTAADELVREAILQAEEEARLIVQDARERIGAVGARTRELLEQSLGVTPQAPARARRQPVRTASSVEERAYAGAVMVEAGPFDDVTQLKAFEDALASIPGVVEAYIRTFERFYAHFALSIDEPTPLIAELRARTEELLRVIDAGGEDLRLEIVRAGDATSSP